MMKLFLMTIMLDKVHFLIRIEKQKVQLAEQELHGTQVIM